MRTGFVLPSCNYNIVLSEDDLKQLLEKGYILITPSKTKGTFSDEYGNRNDTFGHGLTYRDWHGEEPVQFVGIALDLK